MARQNLIAALIFLFTAPLMAANDKNTDLPFPTHTVEKKSMPKEVLLDAVIEAVNRSTVSAETSGRVMEIKFDIGDLVQAGTVLIRITKAEQQSQFAATEAQRNEATARLQEAQDEFERVKGVFAKKLVAQSALDKAKSLYDSTLAKVRSTEATWNSLKDHSNSLKAGIAREEANLGLAATGKDLAEIKVRQVNAQKAKVEMQRARVKQAELNLSYTKIPSPADGFITNKNVEPGLMVANGQHLMAVVPLAPDEVWVTANYKETQLMHIHHGQPVKIKVDSYPGVEIKGRVDSIMAGTGAVFSLFPPENASGNFVKIVQRIPVKIDIERDDNNDLPMLRIGMSVVPTIYTGN